MARSRDRATEAAARGSATLARGPPRDERSASSFAPYSLPPSSLSFSLRFPALRKALGGSLSLSSAFSKPVVVLPLCKPPKVLLVQRVAQRRLRGVRGERGSELFILPAPSVSFPTELSRSPQPPSNTKLANVRLPARPKDTCICVRHPGRPFLEPCWKPVASPTTAIGCVAHLACACHAGAEKKRLVGIHIPDVAVDELKEELRKPKS